MTYLQALTENFDELKQTIIDTNESVISNYSLEAISGNTLDVFGKLHGVERLRETSSSVFTSIVKITFNEDVSGFIIPENARFYVSDDIFFINFNEIVVGGKSGTQVTLDCVLNSNISNNVVIPVSLISRIESSNSSLTTEIMDVSTTRELNFSSSDETDEDYKTRIIQYCSGKVIDPITKLKYILSTVNVTDYTFIEKGVYSGTIEIVIAPPEFELFETYKNRIEALANAIFHTDGKRIVIKKAFLRNLRISSYESVTDEFKQYINSLPMGSSINLIEIRNYCGQFTIAFIDEKQLENIVTLGKYEKIRLEF